MNTLLIPGTLVHNPKAKHWGLGQVQSNVGNKITVNFENCGKVVVDASQVDLVPEFDD